MPTPDPNRMHDIRTVNRHLRAGRTSKEMFEAFLSALPDAQENIKDPQDGGDPDGFDDMDDATAEPSAEQAAAAEPTNTAAAAPSAAPSPEPAPPMPIGTPFSADFDPAAHLADNPMMPPPQPIPGLGNLGAALPSDPAAPSAPPVPSAPVPSAPSSDQD